MTRSQWATDDDMDEAMVQAWNDTVRPEDEIYHLGDFSLCRKDRGIFILSQLNGKKFLARGNHDNTIIKSGLWEDVRHTYNWNNHVLLKHYAPYWEASGQLLCLHGHSHGSRPPLHGMMDVGVDAVGFKPLEMEDAIARATQSWQPGEG